MKLTQLQFLSQPPGDETCFVDICGRFTSDRMWVCRHPSEISRWNSGNPGDKPIARVRKNLGCSSTCRLCIHPENSPWPGAANGTWLRGGPEPLLSTFGEDPGHQSEVRIPLWENKGEECFFLMGYSYISNQIYGDIWWNSGIQNQPYGSIWPF